jgi:hypothetical protein
VSGMYDPEDDEDDQPSLPLVIGGVLAFVFIVVLFIVDLCTP